MEVTFSVSPEIRRSRYHEPWSLDPAERFLGLIAASTDVQLKGVQGDVRVVSLRPPGTWSE
jgi:hypothetical protein